jgi:transcriptional regulator with XRE-family HTH domain
VSRDDEMIWSEGQLEPVSEQEIERIRQERGARRERAAGRRRRAQVRGVSGLDLRAARRSAGVTQRQLAGLLDISQSQVSEIERRGDVLLSTVERYVHALGGTVTVTATLGRSTIELLKLDAPDPPSPAPQKRPTARRRARSRRSAQAKGTSAR